ESNHPEESLSTIETPTSTTYRAGGSVTSPLPPSVFYEGAVKKKVRNIGDAVFKNVTTVFAVGIFIIVVLMAYEMYAGSRLSISTFGWKFLTATTWDPVNDVYGALPFIYGTVVSSALALIIALPLGLGVAVLLSELSPAWIEIPLSFLVELLAAIPSIVYGLWGVFVLVPWLRITVEPFLGKWLGFLPLFRGAPYGFGMLAAGIILTIMVMPIIVSISRDVLKAIPTSQREAALALGATKWESTRIILASSKSGILGAALLGLGRAVGETMAVTMVIGNRTDISASLFNPGYSMASVIANEFSEATSDLYISSLIEIALILFVVTIILNAIARIIVRSITKKFKTA
ncbi:MAG TPA: phosphate ABC transporter permease subunit PstC, partial [Bacteroidota bacterium]|nr:phosphate ABC transporter permease subunit PstC [Bacteroidota bacterium]